MSNPALTWAFGQRVGSAGRKAVLVALADKADEAHSCFPSQATIAAMTEQDERTVRGHLKQLEADGFVTRERRYREGHRTSDRYVLPVSVVVGINRIPGDTPAIKPGETPAMTTVIPADSSVSYRATDPGNPQENPTKRTAARGARISEDWKRSETDVAWQLEHEIPDAFARPVTGEFLNYWLSETGAKATKINWSAAWRKWMSKEWREQGPRWTREQAGPRNFDAERRTARVAASRSPLASARG